MSNVELVTKGYQDFAAGKVGDVLALFAPDIQWSECEGMPFISGDGNFVGPDAVLQNVIMPIPENIDGFHINVTELFGSDDKVVMVGYYEGVYKKTGNQFKANATHVWTVKDGKLTSFFQAVDTATIINGNQ